MIIFHPMSMMDILHMMDAHHKDLQPMMVVINPKMDKHPAQRPILGNKSYEKVYHL